MPSVPSFKHKWCQQGHRRAKVLLTLRRVAAPCCAQRPKRPTVGPSDTKQPALQIPTNSSGRYRPFTDSDRPIGRPIGHRPPSPYSQMVVLLSSTILRETKQILIETRNASPCLLPGTIDCKKAAFTLLYHILRAISLSLQKNKMSPLPPLPRGTLLPPRLSQQKALLVAAEIAS